MITSPGLVNFFFTAAYVSHFFVALVSIADLYGIPALSLGFPIRQIWAGREAKIRKLFMRQLQLTLKRLGFRLRGLLIFCLRQPQSAWSPHRRIVEKLIWTTVRN